MCANVLEMCVSVPHGTYFEQRTTTAHVPSVNNCGFRSELLLAVDATFVSSNLSTLMVLAPDHLTFSASLTATLQLVLSVVCACVHTYFLYWVHCSWYSHVDTVNFILTIDPSTSTLYSTLHFVPQHLIFMSRAP